MSAPVRPALEPLIRRQLGQLHLADFASLMMPHLDTNAAHFRAVCEHLEALQRDEIKHLLLQLPPRHSKTTLVSKLFPPWLVGKEARSEIILASNVASLAFDNSRVARNLVESPDYPFDGVRVRDDASSMELWRTTNDCIVKAVGVGSAVQGRGAHYLVCDDPIASAEETTPVALDRQWAWFVQDAMRRLLPGGHAVVAMYRWSEMDLAGRILDDPELARSFTVMRLPVFAEFNDSLGRAEGALLWPRTIGPDGRACGFTREEIEFQRQLDSWSFSAQYDLRPIPRDGRFFTAESFARRYDRLPAPPARPYDVIRDGLGIADPLDAAHGQASDFVRITAIDAAGKGTKSGSFSAICTLLADQTDIYVCEAERHRLDFEPLKTKVLAHLERYQPELVVIENAAMGSRLIGALQSSTRWPIRPVEPLASKESRAEQILPIVEGQRVRLPRAAPWLADFEGELYSFPGGRYNDMVDTFVWGLHVILTVRARKRQTERLDAQLSQLTWAR